MLVAVAREKETERQSCRIIINEPASSSAFRRDPIFPVSRSSMTTTSTTWMRTSIFFWRKYRTAVSIIRARFESDLNRLLSVDELCREQIALSNMYAVYPDTGTGRKRTSHPAVYPVSLLATLGKAVPALSHRQQWANSEPIMSDHCHVPEPTHVDRAQPRSTAQARRATERERQPRPRVRARGWWRWQGVITGNRANHARSVLSAIQKIDPREKRDRSLARSFLAVNVLSGLSSSSRSLPPPHRLYPLAPEESANCTCR